MPYRPTALATESDDLEIFTSDGLAALLQVIAIDLVLAGDNAIVIGLAAAGLPAKDRNRAILIGIIAATILRIGFAVITQQLLGITGLLLAGGILLLWVCWRMWRELRATHSGQPGVSLCGGPETIQAGSAATRKSFVQAALQIVVADISMSLDNVLAVAGASLDHPTVLIIGLVLSIALMGLAATFVAKLLSRYRWIAYVGLLIILYVALELMVRGSIEVWPWLGGALPEWVHRWV